MGGLGGVEWADWGWLLVGTLFSCLLEAFALQSDNIFVPLYYFSSLNFVALSHFYRLSKGG